jgi:outer membrane protein assembly factor BamD (BamD/ComL family)
MLEKFSDYTYVAEALYERGWAKQNLKELDGAVADYEQAANKSRGDVGARARFMIGEIQFERQEHDAAVKSFLRVMYGYGGDSAPDAVKSWQGSAGYEAGRCAEVQIQGARDPQQKAKLIQDARTYYTFVVEKHANHKLANQAKERLAALANLK